MTSGYLTKWSSESRRYLLSFTTGTTDGMAKFIKYSFFDEKLYNLMFFSRKLTLLGVETVSLYFLSQMMTH